MSESYELEMNFYLSVEGSPAFVEELRDRIDDMVFDFINCGDPECCPEPRGENYVAGGFGSSTIYPIKEEEADEPRQ